jgi:hypothetical protein
LVERLESHRLTAGNVNFSSQEVNRNLAYTSSVTQEYATLDLKDASDRVSVQLVEALLPKELIPYFMACRSTATKLPNGSIMSLHKFAPMGSAICFSVEAFLFWALSVASISQNSGRHYSRVAKLVYVYGDDIIVPVSYFPAVVHCLELFGLLVNKSKSFRYGKFRESCGMDAYDGIDVTPIRLHTLWSGKPSDASAYSSFISYANALMAKGWSHCAERIKELVEGVYGRVPFALPTSAYPGWFCNSYWKALIKNLERGFEVRENAPTHSVEIRARFLSPKKTKTGLDGWHRLLRNVTMGAGDRPDEVTHPRSVKLKRGWRKL